MKRWMQNLKCTLLVTVTLSSAMAFAAEKKNVCAMTINSSDEIDLFKKHLSPEQFNFIELTEVEDKKGSSSEGRSSNEANAWLKASCRQGIKCDVLVISGHFGGAFFGSSGISLALEELETASCDSACSGILHKPKEVFLFGCNTLAGKEKDSRTPEQYARVLVEDGFSREQAQQIAAFRYSPIGVSFHDRMSRLFAHVPRIYGFSSIAPSGKTISPHLRNYLKEAAPTYFESLVKMTSDTNQLLKEKLRGAPFVQTKGSPDANTPVCYIQNEKTSTTAKLKYIHEVLEKGGALELAPYLSKYFNELDESALNPAERRVLETIFESTTGREKLAAFIQKPLNGLLKPQVDTLNLMFNLNWISQKKYSEHLDSLVLSPLYQSSTLPLELVDQLCSLRVQVASIDVKRLKESHFKHRHFYHILECLKPKNPELMEAIVNQIPHFLGLKSSRSVEELNAYTTVPSSIMKVLAHARYASPNVIAMLSPLMSWNGFNVDFYTYVKDSGNTSNELREAIRLALEKRPTDSLLKKNQLLAARDDKEFNRAQVEYYLNKNDQESTSHLFDGVITHLKYFQDGVFAEIANPQSILRLDNALYLLMLSPSANIKNIPRLMEIAKDNSLPVSIRIRSLMMLRSATREHPDRIQYYRDVLKGSNNYQIRRLALNSLLESPGFDQQKDLPALIEAEPNTHMKQIIGAILIGSDPSVNDYIKKLLQHYKPDTDSNFLEDLNSGKIPYYMVEEKTSSAISKRSIYIGVDPKEKPPRGVRYTTSYVLYHEATKRIIALLPDSAKHFSAFIPRYFDEDTVVLIHSLDNVGLISAVLKVDFNTGKVLKDLTKPFSEAQLKAFESIARQKQNLMPKGVESILISWFKAIKKTAEGLQLDIEISVRKGDGMTTIDTSSKIQIPFKGSSSEEVKFLETKIIPADNAN